MTLTQIQIFLGFTFNRPTSLRLSTVAGRDGGQPVGEDRSRTGTGGGEEESVGAGAGVREEARPGERGGTLEGSRRGGGTRGEEHRP